MTKAEFIAWLEGYCEAIEDQEEYTGDIFHRIIRKAEDLEEPLVLPWASDLNNLIGEYVSKLPGPNDWSIDTTKWPDWSVTKP